MVSFAGRFAVLASSGAVAPSAFACFAGAFASLAVVIARRCKKLLVPLAPRAVAGRAGGSVSVAVTVVAEGSVDCSIAAELVVGMISLGFCGAGALLVPCGCATRWTAAGGLASWPEPFIIGTTTIAPVIRANALNPAIIQINAVALTNAVRRLNQPPTIAAIPGLYRIACCCAGAAAADWCSIITIRSRDSGC